MCDCCGKHLPTQVACSALGPMSFAYCETCAQNLTEPESIVKYILDEFGLEGVTDYLLNHITVYKNGKYLSMRDYYVSPN